MKLEELASGPPLDAAIIGGGINGCAIAEEIAARGLRVALFEKDDFGFGTTWRSTKLIHGGLRYLEHGDLRLVFESLRERTWLLRTRPHLVRPQRFLLPMLPWTRRPRWQLRAGLAMYDLLALWRELPGHKRLGKDRMEQLAPFLPGEASGGFSFFDARVLAPERLALEVALEAERAGASIHNHAEVRRIASEGGAVVGVEVAAGKKTFVVPAKSVINAAGPWVDAVLGVRPDTEPLLGVTRGAHIVVEIDGEMSRDAIFSTAKRDGRVFFAVPQQRLLLIGTTDDRYDADPGAIRPTAEDVDYLLDEAKTLLPGLGIERGAIRYAYAGLRPLQQVPGGPEAAISRRHAIIEHGEKGGPVGLFSVVGGKLSTFRPLAREVATTIAPGSKRSSEIQASVEEWQETLRAFDVPSRRRLRMYGPVLPAVIGAGNEVICSHSGALAGEVLHAATAEHASTLSDVLMRRTGIAWGSCRGLCCHREAAVLVGKVLGWKKARRERELAAFERDVAYHLPTPDSLLEGARDDG